MEQPISENLWWVIPDKLAGVRKPTADEILDLKVAGVGAIVSVMDDPSNLDLYEQVGIPHRWLPTKGGTSPNPEQIQELQTFIDEQNRLGHGVAIHCTNGRRRTGTMLAAYLIQTGLTFDEAMQPLLTAKPDLDLRDAQVSFLQSLANEAIRDEATPST
ncbi:MAG: dual specificity protein phosphatase family protein [Aphanocapsa sp. GSE-SYN-MK-11-07L]|jgi:protein-tyrosine phosphatase|nr:dual specificity protein phosphatase family protein [Aphanocapsa sp. GSE-SYN-MK-11-07L]